MKKILFFCFPVVLVSVLYISCNRAENFEPGKQDIPFQNISQVFERFGVSVTTLEEANTYAQKHFLRRGERWDTQDKKDWHTSIDDQKSLLLEDFRSLGMIDEVQPTQKAYTYALLMGACKERAEDRLQYLAELKQRGITFGVIVLLGGARQLQGIEKSGLPEDVTTEAQMMEYLCAHHSKLKHDKVLLVDAPMIKHDDGTLTRPTTDSTIVHFAKIAPCDGSCLVISNNPYVLRQTRVTQRILDQHRFPTQGSGKEAGDEEMIDMVMLLDEFARTVYEEYKRAQAQ